ncbi:hypothetical protein UF75_4900 [Desulfosporosinus sp. I2]|nr:hypothetical protein [Desulfosporosinus sp. I2]KJR44722.1 hypothetical protein UF75_4900 [Desulfosporosinus sp. I2]
MLAFIPVIMIGGFLGGCAIVIMASCFQLIRMSINSAKNHGQIPRAIEV